MGVGFQQNPWTPTPRRGPIAAELKSPGPALVDLPPLLGNTLKQDSDISVQTKYY